MSKLSPFGKAIRKLRIDRGMLLADLAAGLSYTPSYLSQIETGTKRIPDGLVDKMAKVMTLSKTEQAGLHSAAQISASEYKIAMKKGAADSDRELANMMAASFARLSDTQKRAIRAVISKEG